MQRKKVLLLDLDLTGGSSETLRSLLEPSFGTDIELSRLPDTFGTASFAESAVTRIRLDFKRDLIFILITGHLVRQAATLIETIRRCNTQVPLIIVIDSMGPDEMCGLLRLGATDFVTHPLRTLDILPRVRRLLDINLPAEKLTQALKEKLGLSQLIGESPGFLAEVQKIPLVSKCDVKILISGETGTGKELFARAIHYLSPRAHKPFVAVNCGAIPLELVENELFGHARGAYTGASTSHAGLVREANAGTLFLDEIGSLPLAAQVKLLRFIQDKEYRPLGSTTVHKADVRLIAATNADLGRLAQNGKFRQDLYYRLNIISFCLPPLRERHEDVSLLARHFLDKYTEHFNKEVSGFSSEAMQRLRLYDWPGNARELENCVERAVVLAQNVLVQGSDISLPTDQATSAQESFQNAKRKVIEQFEKSYLQGVLLSTYGNISQAAAVAQKNRRAFWQLIQKHGIDAGAFRTDSRLTETIRGSD